MMRPLLLALLAVPGIAAPAAADPVVDRTVTQIVLPAFAQFAAATQALATAAAGDCLSTSEPLRAAFQAAWDAWIPASAYHAGPMEEDGRNLAIAFWPDPKGATPKALRALIAREGALEGRVSAAARGFSGLQALLYDPDFNGYGEGDPACRLVQGLTADLAATAAALNTEWQGFGQALRQAGPGQSRFLSAREARQYLYTAFLGELQFDEEQRLARPLGSFDKPRPERAEAVAAGRSLRNLQLSLQAARALGQSLTSGRTEETFPALDYALHVAERLDPDVFALATPVARMKLQDLKDAIHRSREFARLELGAELGVSAGFNALDGD